MSTPIQATHLTCAADPAGGTHHLTPKPDGRGKQVLTCQYCDRTEVQILAAEIHKARPAHPDDPEDHQPCAVCRREVNKVAFGTWVHTETGSVAGTGGDTK